MRVLSTGEKIRQLRLDLGLNQDDLTNDEITRSLISMIENNKRSLTYKTAKVIASTLNQYYQNLGKEITPDFLLESELEQAERLVKERLEEIQKLLKSSAPGNEAAVERHIDKLIQFAEEWELYRIIPELIESRGRFYYKTYLYNEALIDLFKAQELYLKQQRYDKIVSLYNLMGVIHNALGLYDQAIIYLDQCDLVLEQTIPNNYDRIKMLSIYNRTLSFRYLKRHDLSLKEIAKFKQLAYQEERIYHQLLIMEGNTYRDLKNYEKAQKIYDKLLKKGTRLNPYVSFLAYDNYADIFYDKGQYEKCLEYKELALKYSYESEPINTAKTLYMVAKVNVHLREFEQAVLQIHKAMLLAETLNNFKVILELQLLLIDIQIHKAEYAVAERSLQKLERFVVENQLMENMSDVYAYSVKLYIGVGDGEKSQLYLTRLLNQRQNLCYVL